MDICGSVQLDFFEAGLIDIKVILRNDPLNCTPCRLAAAANNSVVCQSASQVPTIPIANGTLFGQVVPVLAWPESIVLLAICKFWTPVATSNGHSVDAAMAIVLPSVKGRTQLRQRQFSARAIDQLKQRALELSNQGFQSFKPILDKLPEHTSYELPLHHTTSSTRRRRRRR